MRELADSLALDLAAREQELSAQAGCLRDIGASVDALRAERAGLQSRVSSAVEYIQAMAAKRDAYAAQAAETEQQRSHLPSLLARLASSTTAGASADGSISGEDAPSVPSEALRVANQPCSSKCTDSNSVIFVYNFLTILLVRFLPSHS